MNSIVIEGFKEINFNKKYYSFIKELIVEDEEYQFYKDKKIKSLEENGIHLPKDEQEKLVLISKELNEYQSSFTKNILNARKKFCIKISKDMANELSEEIRGLFDKDLALNYSVVSIMKILKNCNSEELRNIVYNEDQKIANKGTIFDNTENIKNSRIKKRKS